jgi:hypothetical protein
MTKELKRSATVSLDCITRHFVDFPLFLVQANAKYVPCPRNNTMRGKGTEAGVLFALYVKTARRSICLGKLWVCSLLVITEGASGKQQSKLYPSLSQPERVMLCTRAVA